jgi:hypothetical protein
MAAVSQIAFNCLGAGCTRIHGSWYYTGSVTVYDVNQRCQNVFFGAGAGSGSFGAGNKRV